MKLRGLSEAAVSRIGVIMSDEEWAQQQRDRWDAITKAREKERLQISPAPPLPESVETVDAPVDELVPSESANNQWRPGIDDIMRQIDEAQGWPEDIAPITIMPRQAGGYLILNGHHRWRAAQEAGLEVIPARLFPDLETYNTWTGRGGDPDA